MLKRVDAEKRKRDIARKAVKLFAQVGYSEVTLMMIAYEAKLARTVIYRHFRSKRDVLDAAIRANTEDVVAACGKIVAGRGSAARRLELIGTRVMEILFERKDFLAAVFDFVLSLVREGEDMGGRLVAFTSVTRQTLGELLEEGREKGEFPADMNVATMVDGLFSQFEATAMRIVLGVETSPAAARKRFADTIRFLTRERREERR